MMVTIMAPFFLTKLGCRGENIKESCVESLEKKYFFLLNKLRTVYSALQGQLKKLNEKIKSYKLA